MQSYSKGAERIRKRSESGRLLSCSRLSSSSSPETDKRDDKFSQLPPELVSEQSLSLAGDESPDHQILMAPRNQKYSPEGAQKDNVSKDNLNDAKKDN